MAKEYREGFEYAIADMAIDDLTEDEYESLRRKINRAMAKTPEDRIIILSSPHAGITIALDSLGVLLAQDLGQ